jgi:phage-related protein
MPALPLKPVIWLGDSLRELKTFPPAMQDEMGYAIYLAQRGDKHVSAKPPPRAVSPKPPLNF